MGITIYTRFVKLLTELTCYINKYLIKGVDIFESENYDKRDYARLSVFSSFKHRGSGPPSVQALIPNGSFRQRGDYCTLAVACGLRQQQIGGLYEWNSTLVGDLHYLTCDPEHNLLLTASA